MADPISKILGAATVVLGAAKEITAMIEKEEQQKLQKSNAITDLEEAVNALKEDMNNYLLFLRTMFAKDANVRARNKLCKESEGVEALNHLEVSLKAAQLLLEHNQVIEHTRTSSSELPRFQPAQRPPIKDLLSSIFRASLLPSDGILDKLKSTAHDVDVCRGNCERSFKRVWNLYQIYHQVPNPQASVARNRSGTVECALDDVEAVFYQRPFSVSAEGAVRVTFTNLAMLNRSSENSTRHMTAMRDIGQRWAQNGMDYAAFTGPPGKVTSRIQALGRVQTALFELLWSGTIEQMKRPGNINTLAQEKSDFMVELYELEKALRDAILRAKKERFAIAFCGMVKAGKSLFLNALIGEPILPSDELPATAWPCRIRHVPGQTKPTLTYDKGPFTSGLRALQKAQYGRRLKNYQPPSDDIFDIMLHDVAEVAVPTEEDSKLKELYASWVDLHVVTKRNLDEFESSTYRLPESAEGHNDVKKLLGVLNDIIRLCFRFKLAFKMDDIEWPLLAVEFNSLRDHEMDGIYEFIDLPGLGEEFELFSFETMVRLVAKDSNAIVPIVSFKELARKDWKRIPDIVSNGFGGRANIVICTHLDQIHGENRAEQLSIVSKVFWPDNVQQGALNNTIPCSSLMGLSARALLDMSKGESKPEFSSFWDDNRKKFTHPCAEKILGVGRPQDNFRLMPLQLWKSRLEEEMEESGLPAAIQKLTREMVDQAKQRALIQECDAVCKQLRKMSTAQDRKLLEARRSKREFGAAKKEFEEARTKLFALINSWSVNKLTQEQSYREKLDNGIKVLSQRAESFVPLAIKQTLTDWSLGSIKQEGDVEFSRAPENARAKEEDGTTVLIVQSVAHAEEFLRLSQIELKRLLSELEQEFVDVVRRLAQDARAKRFEELTEEIRLVDPRIQPALRREIIDDLSNQSVNIRKVAFGQIKNKIKTVKTRHNAATAFNAIKQQLARPLLAQKEESGGNDEGEPQARQTIEDLGFIFRAPITALATIPFILGAPIWPWIKHSQSLHLGMNVVESRYREEIVKPWIKDLATESKKSLDETIAASSQVARTAVENALAREDARYKRESDEAAKNRPGVVANMVALNSSLWAAESALQTIRRELIKSLHPNGQYPITVKDLSLRGVERTFSMKRETMAPRESTVVPRIVAKSTPGGSSMAIAMQGRRNMAQASNHKPHEPSNSYPHVEHMDAISPSKHAVRASEPQRGLSDTAGSNRSPSQPTLPPPNVLPEDTPSRALKLGELRRQRPPIILHNVAITDYCPVASGGFANIYRGEHQGVAVAIKCIHWRKNPRRPHPWEEFMSGRVDREIAVWSALSHPYILKCLGYCHTNLSDFPSPVSPWCIHGSLKTYLWNNSSIIAGVERLRLVYEASLGLEYLHDLGIIHGDLKPENVLIDEIYQVKLCDFGVVRGLEGVVNTASSYRGTDLYTAPELLKSEQNDHPESTFAGDIWAFGCIVLEVIANIEPYADCQSDPELRTSADQSSQSSFKDDTWALLKNCWDPSPTQRPTIWGVVDHLRVMRNTAGVTPDTQPK